jgi:ABC-type lipoprotein release transport system permease subunit
MSHALQRTFDATPRKFVTTAAWVLGAVLVVIVGMAVLDRGEQPMQARSLASKPTVRTTDSKPTQVPTETAPTEEDMGMTILRPHGG